MKTEPRFQDSALTQWRVVEATLWMYHVSLERFALQLFRRDEIEVLYLVAVGCERMSGPFSWKNADITPVPCSSRDSGEAVCRERDTEEGLEVVCSSAVPVRGPATDLDKSFENFLGDAPQGG